MLIDATVSFLAWAGGLAGCLLEAFGLSSVSSFLLPPGWSPTPATAQAILAIFVGFFVLRYRELLIGGRRKRVVVPIPEEADPAWEGSTGKGAAKITGGIQDPKDPTVIRTFDKCSLAPLGAGMMKAMDADEVRACVEKARAAQASWRESSWETRRELLRLLKDYVTEHCEDICRVASRDTGKTMVDGAFGEILTTCEKLVWTIENGEAALAPEYRRVGAIMLHKTARVEYVPFGVLGAIIPWNYPFHNMFGQLISALFSGNAIVIKVSEYSSWSADYYASIVHAALAQVGASPDLLQIVTGYASTGAALTKSGVDKLTFIGSPQVGKYVMRDAAENLTPVVLELGGKDAAIVCEDADVSQVINLTLRGTFQNCGQNCIGLERLVVHTDIYDDFVATMQEKVGALTQGPPLSGDFDCGAMTMGPGPAEVIVEMVNEAVKDGARLLAGGRINTSKDLPGGTFLEPTLLVDVTEDMRIARNEVFGPCMTIMRARDDAHAVSITNSCGYGLGSSVFSLNYARAERIAAALRTGMCNINDFGVNYLCQGLPFGGVGISGFDRFAGYEGLRGCCVLRAATSDRFPGVRTDIPPALQYPITASGFAFCQALINLFYGDGPLTRLRAIGTLLTAK